MYDTQMMNKAWMTTCSLILGIMALIVFCVGLLIYQYPSVGIGAMTIATGKHLYNRFRSNQ